PVTFACLFNQNLGVLTLGAFLVGAATLYLNLRIKQADERTAEDRLHREAMTLLETALEELTHNVQHFSTHIADDNKFLSFPATTFEATFELLDTYGLTHLNARLTDSLRTLRRILAHNRATLKSLAEINPSLKHVSLLDQVGIVSLAGTKVLLEP